MYDLKMLLMSLQSLGHMDLALHTNINIALLVDKPWLVVLPKGDSIS